VYAGFSYGSLRERHHFEDLSIDGRIILKSIPRNGMVWRGLEWIDLDQDWDR
jgi:hypothetical protein